ncbi:MAG: apolipoprotein N-acyltransferase [Planctomycetaceae bacterium]|nr:MAG: apolipoprotein N-acyltransferase [Planctomycetaceae bacterium]
MSNISQPLQALRRWSQQTLRHSVWPWAIAGAVAIWLAQPPCRLWPFAWIGLVPWIGFVFRESLKRRDYAKLYLVTTLLWAVTMQGIRHAHPAMYVAWWALAAYLAAYPVVWIGLARVARAHSRIPIWLMLPILWVGLEWVRNHFLTGISAVMLGHTQADVAPMIQIADLFGSYGVSFVVVLANAALAVAWWQPINAETSVSAKSSSDGDPSGIKVPSPSSPAIALTVAATVVLATYGYGSWRLNQADTLLAMSQPLSKNRTAAGSDSVPNNPAGVIALIGRDEPIVFEQDPKREQEIFTAYFRETIAAAERAAQQSRPLTAVVWPESMFTGGLPFLPETSDRSGNNADRPPDNGSNRPDETKPSRSEIEEVLAENRQHFRARAAEVQRQIRQVTGQPTGPDLIVGCAAVRYADVPEVHCACLHITDDGQVADFYAKKHLVMFGEYIPAIDWLPWVRSLVPPGMGVTPGDGPRAMRVADQIVSPNICIETAVERVTINQVRDLIASGNPPDQIINVTNDGWFNGTSIVEHHLRAAQLVAVGSRRPLLIAANGGPTAWIDGSGRIIERLRNDEAGSILVDFHPDNRPAAYLTLGEWPAGLAALALLATAIQGHRHRQKPQNTKGNRSPGGATPT